MDLLKNGWLGYWVGMPDGSTSRVEMSRKFITASSKPRMISQDLGASWLTVSASPDFTLDTMFAESEVNSVQTYTYTAWAKPTKKSTNKPVYNGKAGLMDVFASCRGNVNDRGMFLAESTLGLILKSSTGIRHNHLALLDLGVDRSVLSTSSATSSPTHAPLTLSEPNNNSPAFKVLPYQISNNGQASIGYQANELTYVNLPPTATDIDGTTGVDIEAGKIYHVVGGNHIGLVIHCSVSADNVVMDNWVLG